MRALLLDFGGVLVDPGRPADIASALRAAFAGAGVTLPSTVDSDVRAGLVAYGHWCEASVRHSAPVELSHREFWTEYVAADWPPDACAVVAERASALCYELVRFDPEHPLRPGMRELVERVAAGRIPLAVVSNTMCGAAHRDYLAAIGLGDLFTVQLYSDEVGLRKPHPELIRRAAEATGSPIEECWYVGDTWSRDIRCARRAGVKMAVLMRSARTATEIAPPGLDADLVVDGPAELYEALFPLRGPGS
jgi:N-acetyl-D-muramate 6-phosphate phosphatase